MKTEGQQQPHSKLKGMFKKGKEPAVTTPPLEAPPAASIHQQHLLLFGELLATLKAERNKLQDLWSPATNFPPTSPVTAESPLSQVQMARSSSTWSIGSGNESIYHEAVATEWDIDHNDSIREDASMPDLSSVAESEDDEEEAVSAKSIGTAHEMPATSHRRAHLPAGITGEEAGILSILRKNMGKDLSRITMPISFNEPLSALQRLAEDFENTSILREAAQTEDPIDRICLIAAFILSGMAPQRFRKVRKCVHRLRLLKLNVRQTFQPAVGRDV
jgi:hypothetical protein